MPRLMIVDDEPEITAMLKRYFVREGYETVTALTGAEALRKLRCAPDMVLLDVNLPDMDGFAVCRALREHLDCPVLFLTARVEDADKLSGFACGGDDYVLKPFSIDELGARVAAHLRRETRRARAAVVRMDGGLAINYTDRTVTFEGKPLAFAKKEFDIIELLSQNPGQVFDKERIYERVWDWTVRATPRWWPSACAASARAWPRRAPSPIFRPCGGAAINGSSETRAEKIPGLVASAGLLGVYAGGLWTGDAGLRAVRHRP